MTHPAAKHIDTLSARLSPWLGVAMIAAVIAAGTFSITARPAVPKDTALALYEYPKTLARGKPCPIEIPEAWHPYIPAPGASLPA